MSTTSPPEPGARARRRRFRTLGAVLVTSLAAPIALVAVTTTAGPAGAAPADGTPLSVSGDTLTRNASATSDPNWTYESSDYDELKQIFDDYGPGGATFDLEPAIASPTYNDPNPAVIGDETGSLADIDVYISSAVGGGGTPDTSHYTPAEEQALLRWVRAGGVLIANTNSRAFDVTRYLGDDPDSGDYVRVSEPRMFFDGTHGCLDQPSPSCQNGQDESAPVASVVSQDNVLGAGVASIRNWHTITYFENGTLPDDAITVATINYDCVDTAPTCADQGATPDYDNDTGGPKTVLAFMPFGSEQFGKGAVVFTSDVDTFSNHYDAEPGGSTEMATGNRQLAENMVDWIADNRIEPLATNGFTPITPTRVYDTRNAIGTPAGKAPGGPNEFRDVQITGKEIVGGNGAVIPADATAVAINLTATNQGGAGFLTVTPGGAGKPNTSNLNIPAGAIDVANAAAVGLGDNGKIRVYNSNNPTDVIVDVVGYWSPSGASFLTAVDPANGRVFDTRNNIGTTGGKIGPGATRSVQITNQAGVPPTATGVVMNVTATNGTTGGFLTIHDTPTAPNASNVNFRVNTNVPNLVFAKLDGTGKVNVTNALGQTDVVFDVAGYFTSSGSEIHAVGPDRIFDTRTPIGLLTAGKVDANGIVEVGINGAVGVLPTDGVGAILANVTVDQPTAGGFLTAYPKSLVTPNASNVNFAPGQTVANLALVKVSDDGKVQIKNDSLGSSNVIVDVFAWFD